MFSFAAALTKKSLRPQARLISSSKSFGLVGLPNSGKSTVFNALVRKSLATVGNFPFCTIDPTSTLVPVVDHRLETLARLENSKKLVPSLIEVVDIAGLVKGAADGKGLGNAFLSTISQVSAILHVVRAFETCDGDFVEHVSGALNPLDDIQLINDELALKDMQNLEKAEQRMKKRTDEATKRDFALKVLNAVGQGSEQFDKFRSALNAAERDLLDSFSLLSMKPQLIIVNVSDEAIANGGNELSRQVLSKYPQAIMLCGKLEADMNDMSLSDADAAAMLHDFGVKVNAYDNVINSAMKLLNLQTFYTVGPQEARSWLFRRGDTAPKCGSLIHTDFEKKFVRVEVIAYDDFVQCGGEAAAKAAAKLRIEGPKYVMNDGDVCLFRIG